MILDACCGSLKIYKGMIDGLVQSGEFVTVDKRKGDFSYQNSGDFGKHTIIVKPQVLADMRFLPFATGSMEGIFCDPPHLKCGIKSFTWKYYGSWSQEETIFHLRFIDMEFARVLRDGGFLFLKIMKDREEIYRGMLKHFTFICPIQIERTRGNYQNRKDSLEGAVWWICQKATKPSQEKACAQLRFERELTV